MDDTELANVRKYLHKIQRAFPKRCDSCSLKKLDRLVAITDSKLFEEIVTKTYRYEEYTFKKKKIRRRHLSPSTLSRLQCSKVSFNKRLHDMEIPSDTEVFKVSIKDPGSSVLAEIQRKRSSSSRRRSQSRDPPQSPNTINWRSLGLRFGHLPSKGGSENALYIDRIRQENPGTAELKRGDRILAVEGIVFDETTLEALNEKGDNREENKGIFRPVSAAVTMLYELMTSILDNWIDKKWPQVNGRPPLRMTIARCPSMDESVSRVPGTIQDRSRQRRRSRQTNEAEELMEVEMIDYPYTGSGIGAFLTPGPDGLGALVERIVDSELAHLDGRLQVDDSILYINEQPVMDSTFKDVLGAYRSVSSEIDITQSSTSQATPNSIRLIVSRVAKDSASKSPGAYFQIVPRSAVKTAAAQMADRVGEENKTRTASMNSPSQASPETPLYAGENAFVFHLNQGAPNVENLAAFMSGPFGTPLAFLDPSCTYYVPSSPHDYVNLRDPLRQGVVIEEALSDEASEEAETTKSPINEQTNQRDTGSHDISSGSDVDEKSQRDAVRQPKERSDSPISFKAVPAKSVTDEPERTPVRDALSEEKRQELINHWKSNLNEDVDIIVGEYSLPSDGEPLGISVETLANVDPFGHQMDFRHRLVELRENGVIARQTELKPRDEVLEVNGITVVGMDSSFLTEALSQKHTVGYIVCCRPHEPGTFSVQRLSSLSLNKTMPVIEEVPSIESVSGSIDGESGIDKTDGGSGSGSRISNLRRKFEAEEEENWRFSKSAAASPPKKVEDSRNGKASHLEKPGTESQNLSRAPRNISANAIEITIHKVKEELIGITLGQKDEESGGFVVTDIAANGAVNRAMQSKDSYHGPRLTIGDVVTEIHGKSLAEASLFSVQSVLWSLFPIEGNVTLKFKPKPSAKPQVSPRIEGSSESVSPKAVLTDSSPPVTAETTPPDTPQPVSGIWVRSTEPDMMKKPFSVSPNAADANGETSLGLNGSRPRMH